MVVPDLRVGRAEIGVEAVDVGLDVVVVVPESVPDTCSRTLEQQAWTC